MAKVARAHVACPDGHRQFIGTALVAMSHDADDYGTERLVLPPNDYPPGYVARIAAKKAATDRQRAYDNFAETQKNNLTERQAWFIKNQLHEGGALGRIRDNEDG
jgi:hypothetical protein